MELRRNTALMGRVLQVTPVLDGVGGARLWSRWIVNGGMIRGLEPDSFLGPCRNRRE
jgi:hypothetical protein